MTYVERMIQFYGEALALHYGTDNAKAVCWGDAEHQRQFYEQLLLNIQFMPGDTICDVGCGLGALVSMISKDVPPSDYQGIDCVPGMVERALKLHPGWDFRVEDIAQAKGDWSADWLIASGVLGTAAVESHDALIGKMWERSRKGLAFNVSSSWISMNNGTAARDPFATLQFCRQFTRRIAFLHHQFYHLFGIVMIREKDDAPA